MENIKKAMQQSLNGELRQIIISNSSDLEKGSKIKIRPVLLKQALSFQVTEYIKTKVFHKNLSKDQVIALLPQWFSGLYSQAEINCLQSKTTILISKKGKITVKTKKVCPDAVKGFEIEPHNRKKQYILQEGIPVLFLQELGVMNADGKIVHAMYDKFKQINRYLEFVEDIIPSLPTNREISIVDFGCGKSYLTFALYYYLHEHLHYDIRVVGLDLKEDVIKKCNELKEKCGYEKLTFIQGDIAQYNSNQPIDMVITLHACDTATDYALYHACCWNASVILSVPCCQHELNRQISCDSLQPILKYGLIKERMASLITDSLRGNLLESLGYKVSLLEFIDMEHTPKNILIRAVKRVGPMSEREKEKITNEIRECMQFLSVRPKLYELIESSKLK